MLRPVYITHHGRDRLVMLSLAAYCRRFEGDPCADVAPPVTASGVERLMEQMSDGFIAFDATLRVRLLNPAAAAALQLARTETIGEKLFDHSEGCVAR